MLPEQSEMLTILSSYARHTEIYNIFLIAYLHLLSYKK